jgi:hypothetical protein
MCGPVFVFSTGVEDNVLFIRTASGGAKPALVSNSVKNFGDWIVGSISLPPALIEGVDD